MIRSLPSISHSSCPCVCPSCCHWSKLHLMLDRNAGKNKLKKTDGCRIWWCLTKGLNLNKECTQGGRGPDFFFNCQLLVRFCPKPICFYFCHNPPDLNDFWCGVLSYLRYFIECMLSDTVLLNAWIVICQRFFFYLNYTFYVVSKTKLALQYLIIINIHKYYGMWSVYLKWVKVTWKRKFWMFFFLLLFTISVNI